MTNKFKCPICNKELKKSNKTFMCFFCGAKEKVDYICPENHYQCQNCRLSSAEQILEQISHSSRDKEPFALADKIMAHPTFIGHGCQFHYVPGIVFMIILRNNRLKNIKENDFETFSQRIKIIPPGACGEMGNCGAAVSLGTAIAILTNSNYMSDKERSLSLNATSIVLGEISKAGGPRCCRQSVYITIKEGIKILAENLDYHIPFKKEIYCEFSWKNWQCKKERCLFYKK